MPTPGPEQLRAADKWVPAQFDGRCARNRDHDINCGDLIGHVEHLGWVCTDCAR